MKEFKTFDDSLNILELFKNIARQKEIAVSIRINKNQFAGSMSFNFKTGDEPLISYSGEENIIEAGNSIEISFFYKDTFFMFTSQISDIFSNSFSVRKPKVINSSFDRIRSRYKIKKSESALLTFHGSTEKFKIIDISATGLSFELILNTFYEGEILRNLFLELNESLSFYFDAVVKYIKQGRGNFTCGLSFVNLEWESSQDLFNYVFQRSYINLKPLGDFTKDEISRIYDVTRYASQRVFGNEKEEFVDGIRNLEKFKDKPTISLNTVYHKNGTITGINSALRIYNRTFFGFQPVLLPETYLNPKANGDIFIGFAEQLLNHEYFENFISYINSDFGWHQSIFENISLIINDKEKLSIDNQKYYEFGAEEVLKEKDSEYTTEIIDNPKAFIDYCEKSMTSLENSCFAFNNNNFALDEIKGIYHTLGYSVKRRLSEYT